MHNFNETLFLWLNAPQSPPTAVLMMAMVCAEALILLVPLSLLCGWLFGGESLRTRLLQAGASGVLGLLIAQCIGMVWNHPRPFAMGLGHQLLPHVADASFPSDHLTLMWSVAFSLLLHPRLRWLGAVLALLGLPMAWARIYLGVHFPLDMVGAALVAGIAALLCKRAESLICLIYERAKSALIF